MKAGMDDVLTKPVRKRELLDLIEWYLAGRHGSGQDKERPRQAVPLPAVEIPEKEKAGGSDQIWARQQFLEFLDNDRETGNLVLGGFLKETAILIEHLEQAFAAGDFTTLHRHAHSLKGGALNLMASRLAAAAWRLQEAARDESGQVIPGAMEDLRQAFDEFRKETKDSL